jgi:hypothetical protein
MTSSGTDGAVPLYVFYNAWDDAGLPFQWRKNLAREPFGGSVAAAEDVRRYVENPPGTFKNPLPLAALGPHSMPWECLLCCGGQEPPPPAITERVDAAIAKHLRREKAVGESRLKRVVPAHVEAIS